jgi:hypothetical protein
MTSTYFEKRVASSELLDTDEIMDVNMYKCDKRADGSRLSIFKVASREYKQVKRFQKTIECGILGRKSIIAFECSISATLHGVCVYTLKAYCCEYTQTTCARTRNLFVSIVDVDTSITVTSEHHSYDIPTDKIQNIFLKKPFTLVANRRYNLTITDGVKSFCGAHEQSRVPFREGVVNFFNVSSPDVEKGQIPGLLLS